MVVVAARNQRDVDRRERGKRDAGVVVTLRSGPAERRGARRPYWIDQNVESGGLDQPAGVADKRQPHLVAGDPRRRRVGGGARRPIRPGLPPPNCQRSTSRSDFGGTPSGSKNCNPSK